MQKNTELVKATKQFAQEHRSRSWWNLGSTLVFLGGLLAVTCLNVHWLIRLPFSILAGLLLVRMFIIYHDYQHGTILRGSRSVDLIMLVYGFFTLNPPSIWNRSHNHHHRNNSKLAGNGIGSYPMLTTKSYARAPWRKRLHYRIARHPFTILLGYFTIFLYGMCLRSLLVNPRQHYDSAIALVLQAGLVVVLALFAPLTVLILAFLIPWMLGAAVGSYLFYAQHNFPDVQFQDRADWDYVFAALRSSSYMTMGPVMHWFTGNIGYHHVHHLNARIPFYRLPEAMASLAELQAPGTTSLTPWAIYRCLRLKLWDPEKKRMVSFGGT